LDPPPRAITLQALPEDENGNVIIGPSVSSPNPSNNAARSRFLDLRLREIKLAGFKSFVDLTSIDVPGQLVGVVGPNGCGKSNIIDAVRWVLGETRAAALRGESMQDVIFNGSGLRKPVARSSVELTFDNSLGRAAGQWSQYAEIAVKRVLQRDGESSYYINNTQVRRRDVQDIFLGTGLGPRAYAIIEQGMISRVIEARPEELRIFIEEAAGVSKYKERRRETEHRLADTRENLARVEDICRELETQIQKLSRQAEVAREYMALQTEAKHKQNLVWWLRRRDAQNEGARIAREVDRAAQELEAQQALLRSIEARLERARSDHYSAGDAVNAAQGALYEANTEVSRLETEIRFVSETRARLEAQQTHLEQQIGEWRERLRELNDAQALWEGHLAEVGAQTAAAQAALATAEQKVPQAETAFRAAQERLDEARGAIARLEQAVQVGETHCAHSARAVAQLEARAERLVVEGDQLVPPSASRLEQLKQAMSAVEVEAAACAARTRTLQQDLPLLEATRATALARLQELERESSTREGRHAALERIQEQIEDNGQVSEWLGRHAVRGLPRLWQKITAEPGWETAVESVLRERLHALELADPQRFTALLNDPPPAKLSVFVPSTAEVAQAPATPFKPLASLVRYADETARPLVEEWLAGCYAVEGIPSLMTRLALPAGALAINAQGHQFSRYAVSFHGPDSGDVGILARQHEIERLAAELRDLADEIAAARELYAAADRALGAQREEIVALQEREAGEARKRHEYELEHLRLTASASRVRERSRQIVGELAELERQRMQETRKRDEAEAVLMRHQAEISAFSDRLSAARADHDASAKALDRQREAVRSAELSVQEAVFAERETSSKIRELHRSVEAISDQISTAESEQIRTATELGSLHDEDLRQALQLALAVRVDREGRLAEARTRHEEVGQTLRGADEERLAAERELPPLRDRIGELRLKEQATRLTIEQLSQQLAEVGADEDALAAVDGKARPAALQAEIGRLQQAMSELGPVNMAALEELGIATERKSFLDAQASDLAEALDTLENAIRRIDRETREMLRRTFDEANRAFSELFPALFGGGEARLVMTGEEILDAGVEVRAQPPGKRNVSIHLLSGGEKALTAIALVFALFQLNPAPFCLLDEVDAPLDDTNTERFCNLVRRMSRDTQFLFISHNKITMELAAQLIGVTMPEQGVSRVVAVDIEEALRIRDAAAA
jgi:chromosome segregation protein